MVNQNSNLCLWTTRAILALALFAPAVLRANAPDEQDSLTLLEENYAYGTKTPSQRVKAFLKIAEDKFQLVKKNAQQGSAADISTPFLGYSTAIEGAWMGVSWGQAVGVSTADSVRAIQKTTKKHLEGVRKLQATANPSQREVLAHILDKLLQIQNLESADLYARR
jgi:hypothetical protein